MAQARNKTEFMALVDIRKRQCHSFLAEDVLEPQKMKLAK
jgi:hypothetical protein